MDYGKLNIHVVSDNSGFPIPDATVQITSENEPENIIEEAVTNNVGQLNDIELAAPPVDYSMTLLQTNRIRNTPSQSPLPVLNRSKLMEQKFFPVRQPFRTLLCFLLPQAKPTVRNFLSFLTIHYGAITRQKYRKVKSKRWKKPEKLY